MLHRVAMHALGDSNMDLIDTIGPVRAVSNSTISEEEVMGGKTRGRLSYTISPDLVRSSAIQRHVDVLRTKSSPYLHATSNTQIS